MIKLIEWLKVLAFLLFFNLLITQVDNYGIKTSEKSDDGPVKFLGNNYGRGRREHRKSHVRHLKWSHSVWLGEPLTSPRLYWNAKNGYVEFKVEANTIGSIEIGFDKEDLVFLWVDDVTGKPHVEVNIKIFNFRKV